MSDLSERPAAHTPPADETLDALVARAARWAPGLPLFGAATVRNLVAAVQQRRRRRELGRTDRDVNPKTAYLCEACRAADRQRHTHPGVRHQPGICDCECRDD